MTTSPQFQITLFGAFNTRFLFGYENKPLLERKTSFLKDKSLYWFFHYSTQPLNIQTVEWDPQTKTHYCRDDNTCGEVDKGTQTAAEDSERGGFPAGTTSWSLPLGRACCMLGGSREPNMLFHSSLTFESCLTCFLAMKKDQNNLKEASMTNPCFYYSACVGWRKGDNMDFMRADLFIFTHKHVSSHFISRTDGQMHFQ